MENAAERYYKCMLPAPHTSDLKEARFIRLLKIPWSRFVFTTFNLFCSVMHHKSTFCIAKNHKKLLFKLITPAIEKPLCKIAFTDPHNSATHFSHPKNFSNAASYFSVYPMTV